MVFYNAVWMFQTSPVKVDSSHLDNSSLAWPDLAIDTLVQIMYCHVTCNVNVSDKPSESGLSDLDYPSLAEADHVLSCNMYCKCFRPAQWEWTEWPGLSEPCRGGPCHRCPGWDQQCKASATTTRAAGTVRTYPWKTYSLNTDFATW